MQQTQNAAISPSSDCYNSFNSSSSQSVKQEPSTPYSPPNFIPDDIMNNLMFVDESSNQLKTEYNSGKSIFSCLYIY